MRSAPSPMPSMALRFLNLVGYIGLIVVSTLASRGVFGPDNATISKKYHTPLTPSGWAFSIWGLIYALQGAAVIYVALPAGYETQWKRQVVNAVGYGWLITWIFESTWLMLFPKQTRTAFLLCTFLLFGALAAIAVTLRRLYVMTQSPMDLGRIRAVSNPLMHILFVVPTSINTAWLSVASCLGVSVLAAAQGIPQTHQTTLAACLAAVVSTIAAWIIIHHRDVAYGLATIWALVAITQAQTHVQEVHVLALLAVAVLTIASLFAVVQLVKMQFGPGVLGPLPQSAGVGDATAAMQDPLISGPGRENMGVNFPGPTGQQQRS